MFFQTHISDASKTRIPALGIQVKKEFLDDTAPPPYSRKYTDQQREWLGHHLKDLEAQGIISKTDIQSPYLSPMQLVAKKKEGEYRLVVDQRWINKRVEPLRVEIPSLEDLRQRLGSPGKYLSSVKAMASIDVIKARK